MLFQRAQRRRALRRTELTVLVVHGWSAKQSQGPEQTMGHFCDPSALWSELRHPSHCPVWPTRVRASGAASCMKPSEVAAVALPISMGAALAACSPHGPEPHADDMRAARARPVAKSVALLFLVGPLCAVALCVALELELDWALGVLLVAVTPPTVGASVFTFLVGGDTATALASSVVSLLLSAVAMPASFVAEVVLFNALGRAARPAGGRAWQLRLPLAQIAATMLVLVLPPRAARRAASAPRRGASAPRWVKRALQVVVPVCVVSFVMTGRAAQRRTTAAAARRF